MSDNQHDQILRIVVQGQQDLETVVKLVRQLEQETGNSSKNMNKSLGGLRNTFSDLAKTAGEAKSAISGTTGNTQSWDVLKNKVLETANAYRTLNQARIASGKAPISANTFLASESAKGVTAGDLAAFQQGSNLNLFDDAIKHTEQSLPRLRYALYDVASTANITALAIGGITTATVVAAASYERAFANVQRTLDPGSIAVETLRQQLIDLSKEIPLSFQDLSAIATLGNQLGVAAQDVAQFTQTVAKFSAVSGIAPEEAAKSFGTLGTILGFTDKQYSNFASAVELVGRKSAATDADILSMTKDIGQQAKQAGFQADQVIALSGALSQLRVAPERARGSLTQYFETLNKAVASGGDDLKNFALITGLTTEQLDKMVRSGQGVEVFQRFLAGLSNQGDVVGVTKALDDLGLSQLRVTDTFQRLSSNQQVFTQYMGLAKQGYTENTELNRQYAIILDTVASKWQIFLNDLQTFAATVGSAIGPSLSNLLELFSQILVTLTGFFQSPIGQFFADLAIKTAGIVTVLGFVIGGFALAAGSALALRTAMGIFLSGEAAFSIRGVASMLGLIPPVADGAAVATFRFRDALLAVGKATIIFGLIQGGMELLTNFGGSMVALKPSFDFLVDAIYTIPTAVASALQTLAELTGKLPGGGIFADWAKGLSDYQKSIEKTRLEVHKNFADWVSSVQPAKEASKSYKDANVDLSNAYMDVGKGADFSTPKVEKAGKAAAQAAIEVRTLVDYANDLGGVFSRSFDLRFGGQQGLDSIATGWQKIADEIDQARQKLADLQAKQSQLAASKSTKEYQLGIAETYGDEKRAVEIRADLTDVNNQLAQNQNDIVKAQDAMKLSLVGNSAAAIQHRADILGLVQTYDGYVKTLAASGLSQDQLKAKVGQLKQEFIAQATQLGFSGQDIQTYAAHFDDLSTVISTVPRNITVAANTNPALQALNEFLARANAARARVTVDASTGGADLGAGVAAQFKQGFQAEMLRAPIPISGYQVLSGGQQVYQVAGHNNTLRLYETGGYTGVGGAKDVAGAVHAGEFVLSKPAVDFFGVGFLNRLHMAGKNGSYGSLNSGGTGPMELSPRSIDQLARAIAYYGPDLTIGNDAIGAAARSSNATSNSQGRY